MLRARTMHARDDTAWSNSHAEVSEATGLLASVQVMPLFFAGWAAIGLCAAWYLIRQGHDAIPALALGVGLGPLALLFVRRSDDGSGPDDVDASS